MNKMVISEELAECVDVLLESNSVSGILYVHSLKNWESKELNDLSLEDMARILIEGYEIEKKPEEKIKEHYEVFTHEAQFLDVFIDGYKLGVTNTLNELGIKIQGINK